MGERWGDFKAVVYGEIFAIKNWEGQYGLIMFKPLKRGWSCSQYMMNMIKNCQFNHLGYIGISPTKNGVNHIGKGLCQLFFWKSIVCLKSVGVQKPDAHVRNHPYSLDFGFKPRIHRILVASKLVTPKFSMATENERVTSSSVVPKRGKNAFDHFWSKYPKIQPFFVSCLPIPSGNQTWLAGKYAV